MWQNRFTSNKYCKRPKSSRFTGFHPNVGKTFAAFALTVWKVLKKDIAELNICWKKFRNSSKIRDNREISLAQLLSFTDIITMGVN